MTRDEILRRVIKVVQEKLGVEGAITESSDLGKDLGGDSLEIVSLLMVLEDEFDVEGVFGEEEALPISITVESIVDQICRDPSQRAA